MFISYHGKLMSMVTLTPLYAQLYSQITERF